MTMIGSEFTMTGMARDAGTMMGWRGEQHNNNSDDIGTGCCDNDGMERHAVTMAGRQMMLWPWWDGVKNQIKTIPGGMGRDSVTMAGWEGVL